MSAGVHLPAVRRDILAKLEIISRVLTHKTVGYREVCDWYKHPGSREIWAMQLASSLTCRMCNRRPSKANHSDWLGQRSYYRNLVIDIWGPMNAKNWRLLRKSKDCSEIGQERSGMWCPLHNALKNFVDSKEANWLRILGLSWNFSVFAEPQWQNMIFKEQECCDR